MILMGINALMGIVLVMAAHTCYLSRKQKIDAVVPTTKPNVSQLPIIREQHLPVIREQQVRANYLDSILGQRNCVLSIFDFMENQL